MSSTDKSRLAPGCRGNPVRQPRSRGREPYWSIETGRLVSLNRALRPPGPCLRVYRTVGERVGTAQPSLGNLTRKLWKLPREDPKPDLCIRPSAVGFGSAAGSSLAPPDGAGVEYMRGCVAACLLMTAPVFGVQCFLTMAP